MILYHFTCRDHGMPGILRDGELRLQPRTRRAQLAGLPHLIWMTDLDSAPREVLGLSSNTLTCDRMEVRFIIPRPRHVHRWIDVRGGVHPLVREQLESAPGVMPMHWYVTTEPQAVAIG